MELAFSLFKLVLEIILHSLKFLDILSCVIKIISEGVSDFLMPIFQSPYILGMNSNKPILHVLKFNIRLPLNSIDLFFQYGDFL